MHLFVQYAIITEVPSNSGGIKLGEGYQAANLTGY